MSEEKPATVYRSDYRQPDYWIDSVDLHFELGEVDTRVRARLALRLNEALAGDRPPLVLHGEELATEAVVLDGRPLGEREYHVANDRLTISDVPSRFELETRVRIQPQDNTSLSGLYRSGGLFCTQCEAMGFRRITWFLDRPDVMALFKTTIDADSSRYPVLLSNGNREKAVDLGEGRHRVCWTDPHRKPSYLFALVAGDLRCHEGSFTTRSGREVRLEIWVEPENIDRCQHALRSLQRAMAWDERRFGLEYDLDVYMIVAVNDFNMGAMENKGLNVFNSKYVLAQPETATDDEYEAIEGVIAHEYFHNWTGNRVTCRDWFQLTLKEGLTVFRDQQFSAEMTSPAVKRIDDVKRLRSTQFLEDAGPMAHPIRPESYISMDNFYTPTVYEKGAEVVRMYQTLLTTAGFRAGMDLYFARHDGQAVTCDDFRAAMADANDVDLELFERWYRQSGTPRLEARGEYDESAAAYTLTLRQRPPERLAVGGAGESEAWEPLQIPVRVGLLGRDGRDLPLRLVGETEASPAESSRVLELVEEERRFTFVGVEEAPVASLLRDFSAPVKLEMERGHDELAFLMANDSDAFNRWEAGHELARQLLLKLAGESREGRPLALDPLFASSFAQILEASDLDDSLKSQALILPSERVLALGQPVIDVDSLHDAREFMRRELARASRPALEAIYRSTAASGGYSLDQESIGHRRLRNVALAYLASLATPETTARVVAQFETADNMTDSQAALSLLVDIDGPEREEALEAFYERWQRDPLVLDKWFSVQALSKLPDAVEQVVALSRHPDFSMKNPNRARSLIGVFCGSNQVRFHRADGAGYRFLVDAVLELDGLNPQVAARMVSNFNAWRRFDPERRDRMKAALESIAAKKPLSKDVFEIVSRALGDPSAGAQ
jgi:aminopeptidase N